MKADQRGLAPGEPRRGHRAAAGEGDWTAGLPAPDYRSDDGSVVMYCGDCLDILPQLPDKCADAVVTDPPYGVNLGETAGRGGTDGLLREAYDTMQDTYDEFVTSIVPRLNMSLDVASRAAVFTGPHIHEQRKPDAIGGVFCPCASGRMVWGFKTFLPVLFYGKQPDLHLRTTGVTLSSTATSEKNGHPCPKPLQWMVWLVEKASRNADTILDPFMGSGTTGVACVKTGRKFIGIELSRNYFDIAVKRIEDAFADQGLWTGKVKGEQQLTLEDGDA